MKREDITKVFDGATDEQINTLLDINSADIGNAKQKLEAERDNYKTQLETAQNALKEFDGVDVKEMQGKIETLNKSLSDKETEFQGNPNFADCTVIYIIEVSGYLATEITGISNYSFTAELRYIPPYQVVRIAGTRQIFIREVKRIAPYFNAGEWEEKPEGG